MIFLRDWYRYDVSTVKQHVPPTSGVYMLFSHQDCVYVGSSCNLQEELTNQIDGHTSPCSTTHRPDEFRYEVVLGSDRDLRRDELVIELNPVCKD